MAAGTGSRAPAGVPAAWLTSLWPLAAAGLLLAFLPWAISNSPLQALALKALAEVEAAADSLPADLRNALKGTLYLSAPMSVIGALGGILYQLYCLIEVRVRSFVEKRCKVSLSFNNIDKHYDVVVDYIGAKCPVETGKLLASTKPRSRPSFADRLAGWLGGKTKTPTLYYQPDLQQGFSNSFLWTDNGGQQHKLWISKQVDKPQLRTDKSSKQPDPECLTLSIWWSTDSQPLKEFMNEALKTMLKEGSEGRVDIYVKHMWMPMWTKAISKEKRDRDTVVLDENLAEYVLEDLSHFFTKKTADWYHNAGIPYRRGYLLYGPPGCGKTSFAQVLAGELGLDVCLMNLSNHDMNDDDLAELLRNTPGRSMLLLEDVDAIFVARTAGGEKKGGVSFSGLLNALDGAAAQEGCVIVLTTNHKDRLDEALVRPGRCDVHVHITKASQEQARRMFLRFFAREAKVKAVEGNGFITTGVAHGFNTGEAVLYKRAEGAAMCHSGALLDDKCVLYVHVSSGNVALQAQLKLYRSQESAKAGGVEGLILASGGCGSRLQSLPDAAVRFSSRIPDRQVSMAKLQGYLMKQKLLAEQNFKARRERDELPECFAQLDTAGEDYTFLSDEEVRCFAAEGAVMNVHEVLDVKVEVEEVKIPIFDHLRRVGVHTLAPIFEHFGIRMKTNLSKEVVARMETWHPDLKLNSLQRDRLVLLINGDASLDAAYALADLSLLRDRFLAAFQSQPTSDPEPSVPSSAATSPGPLDLHRAMSEPKPTSKPPLRLTLLRQSSGCDKKAVLNLLEMAHTFQEQLEVLGKTDVSMWQLDAHFQRYEGDPQGALDNCSRLRHGNTERSPEERVTPWVTTFAFLRRLGLESYAFAFEDAGFVLWSELKSLSKDELKSNGQMSGKDVDLCHAVLSCNNDRPDLLRKFQIPEFGDLKDMFSLCFPRASKRHAVEFARQLTDELGITEFSCLQVENYLKSAKGPLDALGGLRAGLRPLVDAQAARLRPEAPAAAKEPEDWLYTWLKDQELQEHHGAFLGQALHTKEDLAGAPLDHEVLKQMGIQKIGERCKLLCSLGAMQTQTLVQAEELKK